jgi:pimeloyl-ACP methyl ester carboxylesterase
MSEAARCGVSSEASWQLGPSTMHGTLVKPRGDGPFQAVVMAAGSGPTDRDWNSPLLPGLNGSARLLAEELACAGIASLRYDKRASGPHVRENLPALIGKLSMKSHTDELAGAVRLLAEQSFVRDDRIFALGNSEGTLHAMNYQIDDPVIPLAGLVLAAPPGRVMGAVARGQLAEQVAALPNAELLLSLYDASMAQFMAGQPVDIDSRMPEAMQTLLQALETPVNLPFARELWVTDGAALLAQVGIPVLVIIGKKDIQVDWHADGEPLQRAAVGHGQVTFLFPDNANHVLKYEPIPRAELNAADVQSRYNADDARLDPDSSSAIVEWLIAHN